MGLSAGHHTNPEGERKYPGPEAGEVLVLLVARAYINGFENNHQQSEPNAQGWVDIVKGYGKGKLYPRQHFNIHFCIKFDKNIRTCL